MAGAPLGNTNSRKENRLWADSLRRAALQDDAKRLRRAAEKLVELAESGDVSALRELGDRLDGKATQALEHSGPNGEPIAITMSKTDTRL